VGEWAEAAVRNLVTAFGSRRSWDVRLIQLDRSQNPVNEPHGDFSPIDNLGYAVAFGPSAHRDVHACRALQECLPYTVVPEFWSASSLTRRARHSLAPVRCDPGPLDATRRSA
jgi:hypothetical protein